MSTLHQIGFYHGLGDCTYFAHQLPVYCRRGHRFEISCAPDKAFVFADCGPGVTVLPGTSEFPRHSWEGGPSLDDVDGGTLFLANKAACNFSRHPMPFIGLIDEPLWREFCDVKLDLSSHVPPAEAEGVDHFLERLPRPLILIHSKGNAARESKDIDDDSLKALYSHLLEKVGGGTILLLDWDHRVPKLSHGRFRHLLDDFRRANLAETYALIRSADLLIGIDSGPAHFARFSQTPTLAVWYRHFPGRFMLPSDRTLHLVPKPLFHRWNVKFRPSYHLIEAEGERVSGELIAETASRLLNAPRYLGRSKIAADVKLQHHIDVLTRGGWRGEDGYNDRHRGFDLIARHLVSLGRSFRYVETGTIRSREDWKGAGFSTYLFAELAHRTGGHVVSVDNEPARCAFALIHTAPFSANVTVTVSDSILFLREYKGESIDTLYLDSRDTNAPGHAEHALEECQIGAKHVSPGGIIAFDDTQWSKGAYVGKGALGVPWLLEQGWELLHSGHQVVLRNRR